MVGQRAAALNTRIRILMSATQVKGLGKYLLWHNSIEFKMKLVHVYIYVPPGTCAVLMSADQNHGLYSARNY